MLVSNINEMMNSDMFSHSYDDLYLHVTFLAHRVHGASRMISSVLQLSSFSFDAFDAEL